MGGRDARGHRGHPPGDGGAGREDGQSGRCRCLCRVVRQCGRTVGGQAAAATAAANLGAVGRDTQSGEAPGVSTDAILAPRVRGEPESEARAATMAAK